MISPTTDELINPPLSYISSTTEPPLIPAELIHSLLHIRHSELIFIKTELHLSDDPTSAYQSTAVSYISSTTKLPLIQAELHLIYSLLHIRHIELHFINIELHILHSLLHIRHSELIFINTEHHLSDDLTHKPTNTYQSTAVSCISSTTEQPLIHAGFISSTLCYISGTLS
jgi:hypothetical protein